MENFEMPQQSNTPEAIKPPVVEKEVAKSSLEITNEQKEKECRQHEHDMVVENPEFVGINFDHDYIVDARNFWSQERYLQYIQERDGQISDEVRSAVESGQAQKILSEKKEKEVVKESSFHEYVSSFEGKLQHARVHPAGELSPIAPSQALEIKPDGTFDVVIAPEFIDQIKILKERVSDLTLVVPFYDHRRGKEKSSDVPETQEQVNQYIAICEKIIESIGDGVQLEIGNETNISRSTGVMFADKLQHASHVNSAEYGKFFFEVAKKIKEKTPAAKLSIAGVACFDPTYLREVLTEVRRLQTEAGIDGALVDTISFHPYREKPESGSVEVKNGNFTISEMDYERQMEEMQKIASEFGVKLNVGEINFPFSDPEQKAKLEQAVSLTTKKGIESLIYPGVNVH
jgi:hypothetical protein